MYMLRTLAINATKPTRKLLQRYAKMSFLSPTLLRTKWPELPEGAMLDNASTVRNITGWLKQASLEVKQAGAHTGKMVKSDAIVSSVTVVHFNDVYNVEPQNREPVGGAGRFSTALKSMRNLNPLVLFSGDAFSPSILSTFTKGEQMSKVLNELGVHCAVFGNHEFDFGLDVLEQRVSETNFPWLMSNVIDNETGRPLGDGKITHVIDWEGKRIGFIGLVEQEWLETLATINLDEVTFLDFSDAARKLGNQLKEEGCDYVIALTHMRTPNDIKLAENTSDEIDIILGGHDHVYEILQVNGKHIVKSGTDFREFSKITIEFEKLKASIHIEKVEVTSRFEEDVAMLNILESYKAVIEGRMNEVLGHFSVPLEGRFSVIRTQETNLGNWVCDVLLAATGADLVIVNSGTFRSDRVHPPGNFTLGDLVAVVPMQDPTIILSVTGKEILLALENGVSKYPKMEGRFPQVAGISFAFDPSLPEGQRVDPLFVRIGDEYLVENQRYKLATKHYVYSGCDGYTMFKNATVLVGVEMSPELSLAIQNHFAAIKIRQGKARRLSRHRQSLVTLSRRHSLVKQLEGSEMDGPSPLRRSSHGNVPSSTMEHHPCLHHHHHHGGYHPPPPRISRRASLDDLEQETCLLAPVVEDRIIRLDAQKRRELLLERQRLEADSIIREDEETNISPQQSFDKSS